MQIRVSPANKDHKEEWEVRDVRSDKTVPTRVGFLMDSPPSPLQPVTLVKIGPGSLYNTVRLPRHLNLPSLIAASTW